MTECTLHITGPESSLTEISKLLVATAVVCGDPDGGRLNIPLYCLLKTLNGTVHNEGLVIDLNADDNSRDIRVDSKDSAILLANGLMSVYTGIDAAYLPACRFFPVTGNPADGGLDEMLTSTNARRAELAGRPLAEFTIEDLFAYEMPVLVSLASQHRDSLGLPPESLPELINTAASYMWDAAEQFDWRNDLCAFRKYCVEYIHERIGDDER